MTIRGAVDSITSTQITGWAHAPRQKGGLTIQVLLNHELVGEAVADMHRSDLAAAGLGDGNCGFIINLYREIAEAYLPFLSIRPEDSDVEFPRYSPSGFADYFKALYQRFPAAGRQRSQIGGLWTERTDAGAMLRGKVGLGLIEPDIAQTLSHLIHGGYAVADIDLDGELSQSDLVAVALANPLLVGVLHGVLEDHPVVLLSGSGSQFSQPSSEGMPVSPAECVCIIVPVNDQGVELDVVRNSHQFPEFTKDGKSRWHQNDGDVLGFLAEPQLAMLDRVTVPPGSVAVIGAGSLYRIPPTSVESALRLICTPSRVLPANTVLSGDLTETVLDNGVRLFTRYTD